MMTPNKSDRLYLQLRRRIAAMRDGEAFPTVRQLMAEYGVSQSTVTPAINLLKEKGLLEAYVGRGSFVCKQTEEKPCMLLLQNNYSMRAGLRATLQSVCTVDWCRCVNRL